MRTVAQGWSEHGGTPAWSLLGCHPPTDCREFAGVNHAQDGLHWNLAFLRLAQVSLLNPDLTLEQAELALGSATMSSTRESSNKFAPGMVARVSQEGDVTGAVDEGVVRRVWEYGAVLELRMAKSEGYLHISQYAEEYTDPPLTSRLEAGSTLAVVIVRFDSVHGTFEVSHRAYLGLKRFSEKNLRRGDIAAARVVKSGAFACTLAIDDVRAELTAPNHPWSSYRVLFEAGLLSVGSSFKVEIDGWDARCEALRVRLPQPDAPTPSDLIRYGEVILLRPTYVKRRRRLQSVGYVALSDVGVVRVDMSTLLNVEESFPVGSHIPVRSIRRNPKDPHSGILAADIAWEKTKFSTPELPKVGDILTGPAVVVAPGYLRCRILDRVTAFVRRESVLGNVNDRLGEYVNIGDIVEVQVSGHVDTQKLSCECRFLRRVEVERYTAPELEIAPVDLAAVRRTGRAGGFSRDAAFRWNVLEAYGQQCGVCGERYAVGDQSAMEAAHVVPRANRGSDQLQNALCLCPMHHWAFDKGLLTIDENLVVRVASVVLVGGDESRWIGQHHGSRAHLGEEPALSRGALAWHRRNVFLEG